MSEFVLDEAAIRKLGQKEGVTHYTTGVAVIKDGKVLVAQRASHDHLGGVYELPGGGVDEGESITEGAIREIKEELGLEVDKIVCTFRGFDYSTDRKPKARQTNFAVETKDHNVKLDSNEHSDFKWVGPNDYQGLNMTQEIKDCLKDLFEKI